MDAHRLLLLLLLLNGGSLHRGRRRTRPLYLRRCRTQRQGSGRSHQQTHHHTQPALPNLTEAKAKTLGLRHRVRRASCTTRPETRYRTPAERRMGGRVV